MDGNDGSGRDQGKLRYEGKANMLSRFVIS